MHLYSWTPEKIRHVMSVEEASDLVGIGADTIRKAIRNGEDIGFPVFKAGRRYVVPRRPLLALLGITE